MGLPCEQFSVRRLMVAVVAAAPVLAILVSWLRWLEYPHIDVTIHNETVAPIYGVQVSSMLGALQAPILMDEWCLVKATSIALPDSIVS